ncbi:uncharacterized protein STEHIDRAFT_160556 [Stereum hirsutum FP-91666 SS1]|uniref:uncharacterized protein n=1 Tax=Stereum hirsutum (strain FP-91666) TaxID=721885 RepID=UPI0004449542|nr:uncharacterized protein STEHIDRAFT_160556 [Stereum hirsutum FP-91666 SS1]EIM82943.1 hypothetical protein STEHIDRAFT_160556 [Stereum hirsutum FP-91666 SS1]
MSLDSNSFPGGVPQIGSVVSGTESVYTPLYRLLEQLGAGRKSTSALSRSSRYSGKAGRPCIVMEQNDYEDRLFPQICIMATFEGAHPSELTALHRDFIVPVSSSSSSSHSSSSSDASHDIDENEILLSPPVEGGNGHRQWIVAFPYMASNPVKPRRRMEAAGGHTSFASPESIALLYRIANRRMNVWQARSQRDSKLIHRTFEEVQACQKKEQAKFVAKSGVSLNKHTRQSNISFAELTSDLNELEVHDGSHQRRNVSRVSFCERRTSRTLSQADMDHDWRMRPESEDASAVGPDLKIQTLDTTSNRASILLSPRKGGFQQNSSTHTVADRRSRFNFKKLFSEKKASDKSNAAWRTVEVAS